MRKVYVNGLKEIVREENEKQDSRKVMLEALQEIVSLTSFREPDIADIAREAIVAGEKELSYVVR